MNSSTAPVQRNGTDHTAYDAAVRMHAGLGPPALAACLRVVELSWAFYV